MINWISSEDEKNVRKVDFYNLYKIMNFIKNQNCNDEMVQYVCQIYDEYKDMKTTEIASEVKRRVEETIKEYGGWN